MTGAPVLSRLFAAAPGVTLTLSLAGTQVIASSAAPEQLTVKVVAVYPFDATSFTQGLEMDGDTLIVGTGWQGQSRVYRTTLDGQEAISAALPSHQFGEGITLAETGLWQLTWQDGVAYRRDPLTLEVQDAVPLRGQGWGICAHERGLVTSDGSPRLMVRDPQTFADRATLTVGQRGLNELECVGDEIYANVFPTSTIVRIDARTGEVTGVIDAAALPNRASPDANHVLNGIAHLPGTDHFLLAGKRWPDLYEVRFVPAD